jgi:signal transduction histidine kinase
MSYILHPPLLDEGGLPSAVRWYVNGLGDRGGLDIKLNIAPAFPRLAPDMELAIFRVIQECLSNVHRHSGSKSASVRLFCESGFIHLEVRDHGKGMSPDKLSEIKSQASGVGIRGMHERLRHFGGHLVITSDSRGTKISARIPAPVQSSLDPSLHVESQIAPTLPS